MIEDKDKKIKEVLELIHVKVFNSMTKEEQEVILRYCLSVASIIISTNVIKSLLEGYIKEVPKEK
jgi:hypothetical protein